mmetsp:Transcript_17556/g.54863  ORF Transcript_17556/g.54863 Transcript_17556/m.54863 type:complete len:263 (+) Transcript_17556:1541-2329(+)
MLVALYSQRRTQCTDRTTEIFAQPTTSGCKRAELELEGCIPVDHIVDRPDSLLSRFDLLFILIDHINAETDRTLAEHVLTSHCQAGSSRPEQHALALNCNRFEASYAARLTTDESTPAGISFQQNRALHLHKKSKLELSFLRKFLAHVRHCVVPELADDAREMLASCYAQLRSKADDRTLPASEQRHLVREVGGNCFLIGNSALSRIADSPSNSKCQNSNGRDCSTTRCPIGVQADIVRSLWRVWRTFSTVEGESCIHNTVL